MSIRSKMRIRSRPRSAIHHFWPPRPKPLILMYHRIANDPVDPWGLAVSPAHFEEQLEVLRRTRHPLPLTDFVRDLVAGTLPSNAVAVTFDDGYLDNLEAGKPRLAAADVPATVFVATGYLDRPNEFWWDELSRLILTGHGPRCFELMINGKSMRIDLGTDSVEDTGGAADSTLLKARRAALELAWQAIRRLPDDERESVMTTLRGTLAEHNDTIDRGRAMTRDEVRQLALDGLVTIGAHTVTHPLLPELGEVACQQEIAESKSTCEALIGSRVAGFAYPYGGFDKKVRGIVSVAGFDFACSTQSGHVSATSDVLILPRVHVFNWNGDTFQGALRR